MERADRIIAAERDRPRRATSTLIDIANRDSISGRILGLAERVELCDLCGVRGFGYHAMARSRKGWTPELLVFAPFCDALPKYGLSNRTTSDIRQ